MSTFDQHVAIYERMGLTKQAAEIAAAGRGRTVTEARRQAEEAEQQQRLVEAQRTDIAEALDWAAQSVPFEEAVARTRRQQQDRLQGNGAGAEGAIPMPISESVAGRRDVFGREISPITGRPYLTLHRRYEAL